MMKLQRILKLPGLLITAVIIIGNNNDAFSITSYNLNDGGGDGGHCAQASVQKPTTREQDLLNFKLINEAFNGNIDNVIDALVKGANPNAQDEFGKTPLFWAVYFRHIEIIKLLLEVPGINPSLKDNYGNSPMSIAIFFNSSEVEDLLTISVAK